MTIFNTKEEKDNRYLITTSTKIFADNYFLNNFRRDDISMYKILDADIYGLFRKIFFKEMDRLEELYETPEVYRKVLEGKEVKGNDSIVLEKKTDKVAYHRGESMPEEIRLKHRKTLSTESRERMRKKHRPFTAEQRLHMAIAQKKRWSKIP